MRSFWKKHQEFIRYALFGIAAVVADVGAYALTVSHVGIRLANAAGWAAALVAAFITNKYWVFSRKKEGMLDFLREFVEFTAARLASFFVQVWGTDALVRHEVQRPLFGIPGGRAKTLVTIVVIALNYLFSKFLIFRPREVKG